MTVVTNADALKAALYEARSREGANAHRSEALTAVLADLDALKTPDLIGDPRERERLAQDYAARLR